MARIEWVVERLEHWAIWASRGGAGSTGFAKQSVLANDGGSDTWARGSYRHVAIPVNEEEAAETDRAVSSMRTTRPALVRAVVQVHLNDKPVVDVARAEGCSRAALHARLAAADRAIAMWLTDRAVERDRAQANAAAVRAQQQRDGSFTP